MSATWHDRYARSMMNTFGPPKLVLTKGEGAHVWDENGKEYVDLLGGIAVNALGHAHPALVEAVDTQMRTLGHVSNFFATQPQVELAEKLVELLLPVVEEGASATVVEEGVQGASATVVEEGAQSTSATVVEEGAQRPSRNHAKVFFSNSGTEANEAAFKLTRRTGRTRVVVAEGSFHGRTMGALALTSKEAYRTPFEPLPGEVTFVPYGDSDALATAVDDETAAVLLEPIQGEAGVVVPPDGYLADARRIASEHGALLWFDEVQTGIARTGAWFAHSDSGVTPDLVTLAKGLGGGIPIGATVAVGDAADLLEPGNHGTTFGGNPVATAAALAVLRVIEHDGLLARVAQVGERLREGLAADPRVTEVRGSGLLIGLDLAQDASAEVTAAALDKGYIINNPTPNRIRLAPPLVLTDADVEAFLADWPGILDAAGVAASGEAP